MLDPSMYLSPPVCDVYFVLLHSSDGKPLRHQPSGTTFLDMHSNFQAGFQIDSV